MRRRLRAARRWVVVRPAVGEARAILADDRAADGSLLSAGLAFRALFAILPALLLLAGLVGLLVADPVRRAEVLGSALRLLPAPLAEPFRGTLEGFAAGGSAFSVIGLGGLAWGASGFYGQLDTAMARLLPGPRRLGAIAERLRGFAAIVGVAGVVLAGLFAGGLWSIVAAVAGPVAPTWTAIIGGGIVLAIVMSGMDLLVYRWVPMAPPDLAAALPPATLAGAVQGLITVSFAILEPWLVGSLSAFGALVGVLAALVWLELVIRLLVLGAVWAHRRRDGTGRSA